METVWATRQLRGKSWHSVGVVLSGMVDLAGVLRCDSMVVWEMYVGLCAGMSEMGEIGGFARQGEMCRVGRCASR